MSSLELTVSLKQDGVDVPGFPLIRRATFNSIIPLEPYEKAPDSNTTSYTAIPGVTADLQCLILTADQALNLKLNGSATPLPLNANGVLILFGLDVTAGSATNATLNNPSTTVTANVTGVVGGA